MMPEPGFQKPMPYLAPADDRKSYTSLFVVMACSRSATPPNLPFLQCTPQLRRLGLADHSSLHAHMLHLHEAQVT